MVLEHVFDAAACFWKSVFWHLVLALYVDFVNRVASTGGRLQRGFGVILELWKNESHSVKVHHLLVEFHLLVLEEFHELFLIT